MLKEKIRTRRGLTGLETAIILIAFVIVAAAFAFAVLNMGFQTSQRSVETMQAGLQEASSAVELDGAVIAYGADIDTSDTDLEVMNITFCIRLSAGKNPVDLSPTHLAIAYSDPYLHKFNVHDATEVYTNWTDAVADLKDATGPTAVVYQLRGDGDTLLEYGERFVVAINITKVYGGSAPSLQPNDEVKIEVKPSAGAILTVVRHLPAAIDPVMNLG